jgi:hypothetical protein
MGERITHLTEGDTVTRLIVDPEDIDNPILAFFLTNWRKQRGSAALPPAGSFSLDQAGAHRDLVMVVDALPDYTDFRFRFVGEKFSPYFGGDGTGKTITEAFGSEPAKLQTGLSFYRLACTEALPLRMTTPNGETNGVAFSDIDSLFLPYATAGARAEMVVAVHTFNYEAYRSSQSMAALVSAN